MTSPTSSGNPTMGHEELRMEDLLQAQFDNNVRLDLFEGLAAFNLNMLIHQINKSKYFFRASCRGLTLILWLEFYAS